MNNYNDYKIEDFIHDAYFREWVLNETTEAKTFWEAWLLQYPEKKDVIETAKILVLSLHVKEVSIPDAEIQEGIKGILQAVKAQEPIVVPFYQSSWFRMAATIALLVTVGFWWFNTGNVDTDSSKTASYTEGVINKDDKPSTVTLPDGSTVVLQKNSEIRYNKDFNGNVRAVQFKGEGLFDVVKNPEKPFIVYSGDVVTKVLGTSFTIKAFDTDNQVTVNVIHGKVSVTKVKKQMEKQATTTTELILIPNQKAVFSKKEDTFEQTLADAPKALDENNAEQTLTFDEAPVKNIFEALEKKYGVDIVFDEKALKNCALTTVIGDETLYDELNLIRKITGASYKVVGVQVVIEGKSCQ